MSKWITIFFLYITLAGTVRGQVLQVNTCESPSPGTLTSDTLYYSRDRPLQWSDFLGKPRSGSPSAALTFTGFSYDASALQRGDTILVTLYLQVYFDRHGSWVRPGEKNAYALSHEQLHFDIARLAEQGFRDSVLVKKFSPEYYPIEIHFLFWEYWRKMNDMQQQFDADTRHGRDHAREAEWEKRIRHQLLSGSGPG